jgi:hypothetical protein
MTTTSGLVCGDYLSYDDMEELDDRDRDDFDRRLRARDLCRIDDGDGYVIGWYYAKNGDRLDEPVIGDQPVSSDQYDS